MTICPNLPRMPRIWFQEVSGKFGQMVIFGLPGIKFDIKSMFKSLISLWKGSLHNVLIMSRGCRTWPKGHGQIKSSVVSDICNQTSDFSIFTYSHI